MVFLENVVDTSTGLLSPALGPDPLAVELVMLEVSEERTRAGSGRWGAVRPAHLSTLSTLTFLVSTWMGQQN